MSKASIESDLRDMISFEELRNIERLDNNANMFKQMLDSGLYNDILKAYLNEKIRMLPTYSFGVSMLNAEKYIKISDVDSLFN